jgi:hypothetical protein
VANAIPKATVTAKGDVIVGTAASTVTNLAVGADGTTLVANSSASTGVSWAGQPFSQPVLNSAFQVWQRGTSFAATGNAYTADRWQCYRGGIATTVSRQSTGLTGIQYGARVQRDSGNTFTTAITLGQPMETVNSIPFAGKTITLSFYAKAGANFSAASSQIFVNFYTGTGTDENYIAGYTGQTLALSQAQAITTTYARYSATFAVGSTVTEMAPVFSFTPVGTAGANDWFEVTGVQIDLGSVALPFRTNSGTLQGELAACQRYYYRTNAVSQFLSLAMGNADTVNGVQFMVKSPVTMRVIPTALDTSAMSTFYWFSGAVNGNTPTTVTLSQLATQDNPVVLLGKTAAFTSGANYILLANTSSSAYLGFSAEL